MTTEIAITFNELFYGAGSWLGLLLLLALIVGISLKAKYAGVLMLPVTIFLGIDYINHNLYWNSLIMFFSIAFIIVTALSGKKD